MEEFETSLNLDAAYGGIILQNAISSHIYDLVFRKGARELIIKLKIEGEKAYISYKGEGGKETPISSENILAYIRQSSL